ncbi:hypothetical protein POM88_033265 [Heracleum sosnowskyi]|uniref:diacylglycerol O-acyltransferase n=1 Tax=Heracleum sosnowskyi TaxID=360622 RepID=A0AAD8MLE4_9APIA|nr:hypothetical protein POM88_033265 [Heracleum sosnowskyi]
MLSCFCFEQHDVQSLLPVESETDDLQDHIILCGFGCVGQIFAQLEAERLIQFVALDVKEVDRVSVGRALDLLVYFGDAGSRERLNILDEILRFGYCEFYKDWLNAKSAEEYWRKWNMPVHKWMIRQASCVISISEEWYTKGSRFSNYFYVSAVFMRLQLCIAVPFHIFKFWCFMGMMLQVPLVLSTKYLQEVHEFDVILHLSIICRASKQLAYRNPDNQGDSGLTMISFAEYFVMQKDFPKASFDIVVHRSRIAFCFYSYAMAKQIYCCDSDREYIDHGKAKRCSPKRTRVGDVKKRKMSNVFQKTKKQMKR